MRLDFNVLWVDDQPARVKAQHDQIAIRIRKEGFRLNALFSRTVEDAIEHVSDAIYIDHVDLILMDYDLGRPLNGAHGLVNMRERMPYKEMVFYSAQAENLRAIVQKEGVDGVYVSARDGLIDDVVGIFQMLVKKVIDIEHSRGIVLGATSEIDHVINDCLVGFFDKCNLEQQANILGLVAKRLGEIKERLGKELTEFDTIKHVSELEAKHAIYTSSDRLILLRKILELLNLHTDKKERLVNYGQKVVPRRNDLAHVRVQVEGFARKLLDRNKKEFTVDDMRTLRVEILDSRELLEALKLSLKNINQ